MVNQYVIFLCKKYWSSKISIDLDSLKWLLVVQLLRHLVALFGCSSVRGGNMQSNLFSSHCLPNKRWTTLNRNVFHYHNTVNFVIDTVTSTLMHLSHFKIRAYQNGVNDALQFKYIITQLKFKAYTTVSNGTKPSNQQAAFLVYSWLDTRKISILIDMHSNSFVDPNYMSWFIICFCRQFLHHPHQMLGYKGI